MHRVARWLPPLLFTLSAVSFAGFRDSVLWEAMPAPLYVLFALTLFNKPRNARSFLVLYASFIFMLAGLNYAGSSSRIVVARRLYGNPSDLASGAAPRDTQGF